MSFPTIYPTNLNLRVIDLETEIITPVTTKAGFQFTAVAGKKYDKRFLIIGDELPLLEYPRAVANGNWASICFDHKFETSTIGVASLYKLTAINSAGTKVALDAVAMADAVAGVPYIFQSNSTEAKQAFKYKPENKVLAPVVTGTNGLNGVFADSTLTEQKWVITNNAVTPAAAGSSVPQYRCFIDLNQTPVDDATFTQQVPGRRIFNVKNTPTGVEMLEETSFPSGEDRGEASKMMIDGKLVIIKDGKMFNAQGQEL